MTWNIETTTSFETWFDAQAEDVRVAVLAHLEALATEGPRLGRPYCDTLKGTELSNLKELRVQVGGDPYRVLFAFDSERSAVLLVAGNKRGDKRWYTVNIPIAEKLFTAWEAKIRQRRLAAKAASERPERR
ncbi:MAG: type II toxin-antitoxin system RelE/ParE family toxin [Planctomycetota bacterium]